MALCVQPLPLHATVLSDVDDLPSHLAPQSRLDEAMLLRMRQEKAAMDFLRAFQQKYGEMYGKLAIKEIIKASAAMIPSGRASGLFEALRDRTFTMGRDDTVHLAPDIVAGLQGIHGQSPDQIRKLTGMGPEAWKVFLWALYVRSRLAFCEGEHLSGLPENALGMERYRRNALALMMLFIPVIAQGCKRSLAVMPVLPMPLIGLSPMQKQALIDKKKSKPEDLNQLNYTIGWEPLLPMEHRMPRLNLPVADAKGNAPSVAGSDDVLKALADKAGIINNVAGLVGQALVVMRESRSTPEERLIAAGVLEQCAPVSMLPQIVDMALVESNDVVLMKLLECVLSMLDFQSPPAPEMLQEYGRLVELAENVKSDKIRNFIRAMAHFIEHEASQEIFFRLLQNGGPKMRELVIEDLAKYPDKRTAHALMEIAQKDQGVAKQARKEVQRILPLLDSHALVDLLGYEDNSTKSKIIDCLAGHSNDDAVSALAEMATSYPDANIRSRAVTALAGMDATLDIGHLSVMTRVMLLSLEGLPGDLYQRLAHAPWEFVSDANHQRTDFDFFIRSIPLVVRESERLHLLDVAANDLPKHVDFPGIARHARGLAVSLYSEAFSVYRKPVEKILALLPDLSQAEERFSARVEELMGKGNEQIVAADLVGLLGDAYELVSPLAPAKGQARLALLLRRLDESMRREWQTAWEALLRFALTERFGIDERIAREALEQKAKAPTRWIIERLATMDDGSPLPLDWSYQPLSDTLVQGSNPSIFMQRIPGTTRFRAPFSGGLPVGPSSQPILKPLRENLTDEEIRVLKLYKLLDRINLEMYSASLAKTHAKRQREGLERRKSQGSAGLDEAIAQYARAEADWEQRIQGHYAELQEALHGFPPASEADSDLRRQARAYISKALRRFEENHRGVVDIMVAAAKRRLMAEFQSLWRNHTRAIGRVPAEELMAKSLFGQDLRAITIGGFGMRITPEGEVIIPRRHYHQDRNTGLWVLPWDKDKFSALPKALRQKIHIQEGEWNEFQRMTRSMRAIVDMKSQLASSEDVLNAAQRNTMAHLFVMMMLRLNTSAFQKLIREEAAAMRAEIKPVLAGLGIRGKQRDAFLKKALNAFSGLQHVMAVSDRLHMHRDERVARIAEFERAWDALLTEFLHEQDIRVDAQAMDELIAQWRDMRVRHVVSEVGELIIRMDPYGKIKDPFKRHALLNMHMAAKLLIAGRLDRNVTDFLETAQAYLYKRMRNASRIRDAVRWQAASLRAEADRIARRDDAIRSAVDAVEKALKDKADVEEAARIVQTLLEAHLARKVYEPGIFRVRERCVALLLLIPDLQGFARNVLIARAALAKADAAIAASNARIRKLKFALQAAVGDATRRVTEHLNSEWRALDGAKKERVLRARRLEERERAYQGVLAAKVTMNLAAIREDVLHKYKKVVPPKPDANRARRAAEMLAQAA